VKYGKTRNFINGSVTRLSPYISRGVLSTKQVLNHVLDKGYEPRRIEKFIQELAWRDYWQQIWIAKRDAINSDLKQAQEPVSNYGMPRALLEAKTGIEALDTALLDFYKTGYLHNHVRMYLAAVACNIGQSHWKVPAQWMYYHLLDGDWASNALSWQWVAGSNSHKKYVANQDNINRYCFSKQKNTFLDVPYEAFQDMKIPVVLLDTLVPELQTPLPDKTEVSIESGLPTLVYNFYNLDPEWKKDVQANRILLLEPSAFEAYPISKKSVDFMLGLAKNIEGMQVYVGEFKEMVQAHEPDQIYFKEHPLNAHYQGIEEPRDWMFDVKGYYPSFFSFWKKCKKELGLPK
jgi:deoxyribodipyrimidine photo-lyase